MFVAFLSLFPSLLTHVLLSFAYFVVDFVKWLVRPWHGCPALALRWCGGVVGDWGGWGDWWGTHILCFIDMDALLVSNSICSR